MMIPRSCMPKNRTDRCVAYTGIFIHHLVQLVVFVTPFTKFFHTAPNIYLSMFLCVLLQNNVVNSSKSQSCVLSMYVHQYQVRFTNRNPTERSFVLYRCEIRPAKIQTSVHHCCGFLHRLHRSHDPPQVVQDRDHQKEVVQTNHACRARFNDVQYRLELLFPGKAAHFVVNDRDRAKPLVQVMNRERHQHNH